MQIDVAMRDGNKLIHGGVIKKHLIKPLTSSNEFFLMNFNALSRELFKEISSLFLLIEPSFLLASFHFQKLFMFYLLFDVDQKKRNIFTAQEKWKINKKHSCVKQKVN